MSKSSFTQIVKAIPQSQIYLIAGPTGSGKTYFSRQLAQHLEAMILSLDDYFRDKDQVDLVYCEEYGKAPQLDSPLACDFDILTKNINELLLNGYTLAPKYCFIENRRLDYIPLQKKAEQPMIIEGLYAIECKALLYGHKVSIFSIFIIADEKIRSERIRIRDAKERGQPESIFEKRFYFIKLAEQQWILQQQDKADFVIDTSTWCFNVS